MRYPIADAHVDVLWKMEESRGSFYGDSVLQASFERLRKGGVTTQVFAVFVDPALPATSQLNKVLRSLDIFQRQVVRRGSVGFARTHEEMKSIHAHSEVAGLLSLEGAACLQGDLGILRVLHDLGIRGIGLTWNHANDLADGCREPRGGGLTGKGIAVVQEMERIGMWIDVAHLADAGVKDVFRKTSGPIMASHANSRHVFEHPRNLKDETIVELIERDGWMGLTFEGAFVADPANLTSDAVFRHIDHILELGGENHVGFGSDFDGTSNPLSGLADASDYASFQELLFARYGPVLAMKISHENFEQFVQRVLPR